MLHLASQTGRLLHEEHMATIELLQTLESLLDRYSARKVPDMSDPDISTALTSTRNILDREIGRHFGFEEQYLFPRLADLGQVGMTLMLKAEHDAILPVATALADIAREALETRTLSPAAWKQFHELGMELMEREACHIQKEEMGLLAAIAALVSSDEDAEMAAVFRALN